MADFRYIVDGEEVEAFQVTEESLFQDSLSPDWMTSKMLLTKGGADSTATTHWLSVSDIETQIPKFGWIIRRADGTINAVDYSVMEAAAKVVQDPEPERDPPAEVNEEGLLELAAKLGGTTVEELKAKQAAKSKGVAPVQTEVGKVIAPAVEDYPLVIDMGGVPVAELITLLEVFKHDKGAGIKALKASISQRVTWCSCPPGQCAGGDIVGCRQNSPLAE